jgi:hypothetical protein
MKTPFHFKTSEYSGCWLSFDGDRMGFRSQVERLLNSKLGPGTLMVDDQGPQGFGLKGLSYAHTNAWGLLVWSQSHRLGVDIERADRTLSQSPKALSKRYFGTEIENQNAFLNLWCKKEAYAKWTRLGLSKTLHHRLDPAPAGVRFLRVPVAPLGLLAWVALDFEFEL